MRNDSQRGGFTLIELLVVIVIIANLAVMLLPALSQAKHKAQGVKSVINLRPLQLAWLIYSGGASDLIVPTGGIPDTAVASTDPDISNGTWVHGDMSLPGASGTAPALVQARSFSLFLKSLAVYKCPADGNVHSGTSGTKVPIARSMSMNGWPNPLPNSAVNFGAGVAQICKKQSEIRSPANAFVTIDAFPGTINDGWLICDPFGYPTTWVDMPAFYHNRADGISFAAKHAQIKKWTDSAVHSCQNVQVMLFEQI